MKLTAAILAVVGAAVLAAGLFLGLSGISRDGTDCGTGFGGVNQQAVFAADLQRAQTADSGGLPSVEGGLTKVEDDCTSAVSDRQTLAWVVTVPGGVLIAAGLVLWVVALNKRTEAEPVGVGA